MRPSISSTPNISLPLSILQYDNPNNPDTYFHTMGPEIWAQTGCDIDYFVAAGSTGGTVSGTGRFLKKVQVWLCA